MCKPTKTKKQSSATLLLSTSSFHCCDEKGEKAPLPPSKLSSFLTVAFLTLALVINEHIHRYLIAKHGADLHPIMEVERNQHILARHIAVDAFSCLVVAYFGYVNRHILSELMTFKRDNDFDRRIYTYQPAGHQVLLYFFAYQVKNMYDTIYWGDGIIFILHHIFAGMTAWFGMYPGVASMYGLFFMGMSEISTCILCLLANFDPDFGVSGLEHVFPNTRIFLGAIFVLSFLLVRIVLWPLLTYHFLGDVRAVLKRDSEKETGTIKFTLKAMMVSSIVLTVLQFVWLGEIITTSIDEVSKFMEN